VSGRAHPAVERYVAGLVSPAARIAALEAKVERLERRWSFALDAYPDLATLGVEGTK